MHSGIECGSVGSISVYCIVVYLSWSVTPKVILSLFNNDFLFYGRSVTERLVGTCCSRLFTGFFFRAEGPQSGGHHFLFPQHSVHFVVAAGH